MGLVDPPRGVWLEPWLIYEVDDLERETYRALLQLVGWMWVTKKDGGPLRTTVRELAERWGIGERAVYSRLAAYRERGYLVLEIEGGRVRVRLGNRQTDKQTDRQTDGDAGQVHDRRDHGDDRRDHGDDRRDHKTGGAEGIINVCSGSSDLVPPEKLLQTNIDRLVEAELVAAGVRPAAAAELAGDVWVTERRVQRWLRVLQADESVRSVPAVLCVNLREHWEPPLTEWERRRAEYRQMGVVVD